MTRTANIFALLALLAAGPGVAAAAGKEAKPERATADEAVALVKKAKAYVKDHGKEKAFAEFSDPKGAWVDRDLYITVYDLTGTCLAHGFNPKLVGKNMIEMKDVDGKPFVKERQDKALTQEAFWIDYKYVNPLTKAIEKKRMYTEKAGDVLVCAGVYVK